MLQYKYINILHKMYGKADTQTYAVRQVELYKQIIKTKIQRMIEEWALEPGMRGEHGNYHECRAMIITLDTLEQYLDATHLMDIAIQVEGTLVRLYSANKSIHKKVQENLAYNGFDFESVEKKVVDFWYPKLPHYQLTS